MEDARGRFVATSLLLSLLLSAFVLSSALTGCAGGPTGGGGGEHAAGDGKQGGTLTILAASSLTDAFRELAATFEKQNPGIAVRTSFGASSALLTQLQQGAPADVFASADQEKMHQAQKEDLMTGQPRVFARNHEVLIIPKDNPADVRNFKDLAKPDLRLVLAQKEVPVAEYTMQILDNAARDPGYGPHFKRSVLGNIVSREADVRASVNRAVVGDADATFGYASDVTPGIRDQVKVIQIPEDLNVIATYPIGILKASKNKELARMWVELVLSSEGQQVLKKWDFEPAVG